MRKRILKEKKGFLLAEETLKLILGVIAIGFLIYLLFSLYNAGQSTDLNYAKSTLSNLQKEIDSQTSSVQVYNPSNWFILSQSSTNGNELCVCKAVGDCSNNGACTKSDFTVKGGLPKQIKSSATPDYPNAIQIASPPLVLSIDYQNKIISEAQ